MSTFPLLCNGLLRMDRPIVNPASKALQYCCVCGKYVPTGCNEACNAYHVAEPILTTHFPIRNWYQFVGTEKAAISSSLNVLLNGVGMASYCEHVSYQCI
jgi:hypothetical protein